MLNIGEVVAFIRRHTSVPINFALRNRKIRRIKPKLFWRLQT